MVPRRSGSRLVTAGQIRKRISLSHQVLTSTYRTTNGHRHNGYNYNKLFLSLCDQNTFSARPFIFITDAPQKCNEKLRSGSFILSTWETENMSQRHLLCSYCSLFVSFCFPGHLSPAVMAAKTTWRNEASRTLHCLWVTVWPDSSPEMDMNSAVPICGKGIQKLLMTSISVFAVKVTIIIVVSNVGVMTTGSFYMHHIFLCFEWRWKKFILTNVKLFGEAAHLRTRSNFHVCMIWKRKVNMQFNCDVLEIVLPSIEGRWSSGQRTNAAGAELAHKTTKRPQARTKQKWQEKILWAENTRRDQQATRKSKLKLIFIARAVSPLTKELFMAEIMHTGLRVQLTASGAVQSW